jgi:hypothetical protein
MTLDCLDNLIGIDGSCNDNTPFSGLNITDLTGISLKSADAAIDKTFVSGKSLIEKKIQLAKNAVLNRLRAHLAHNVEALSVLESDTIGHYKDNLPVEALEAGFYRGIRVRVDRYPYLSFFVNTISLQFANSVSTNIRVFDLISGLQVGANIPITTVANEITTVQVNRDYLPNKQKLHLIFVVDAGVSNAYETNIHRSYYRRCAHCYECWDSRYVWFQGAKIATGAAKIQDNLVGVNGTFGMSMNYNLSCSLDAHICNMGNQLAWSILYKAGSELMKEMKHSTRLNSIINIYSSDIAELEKEFNDEFENSIKEVMENAVPPNDFCFKCNPITQWQVKIP